MADPIRTFFDNQISPDAPPIHTDRADEERRRASVAACALLLELAHADDVFSDSERTHIETLVRRQFGLNADGAQELIAIAEVERSQSSDLYQMTSLMREKFDQRQKTLLVEVMWSLALSDGEIAQHEASMMTKVADLLAIDPDDLAQARERVESKRLA
ncbi:MAG TPA: TerB family tellurite resistance protein [Longimicrobiales bacterium]|nr:TerB family tellurite resistance protein [Longimicrobiales bacterium]